MWYPKLDSSLPEVLLMTAFLTLWSHWKQDEFAVYNTLVFNCFIV